MSNNGQRKAAVRWSIDGRPKRQQKKEVPSPPPVALFCSIPFELFFGKCTTSEHPSVIKGEGLNAEHFCFDGTVLNI